LAQSGRTENHAIVAPSRDFCVAFRSFVGI
jgi:hypothetical protein